MTVDVLSKINVQYIDILINRQDKILSKYYYYLHIYVATVLSCD